MARIVLISPYLKGGQNAAKLAQRTRYVATRPGVELLADERSTLPATKKQQDFIARLLKSFPSCWELIEYEEYLEHPTQGNASAFIQQVRENYMEALDQKENFIDYISHRPGVQKDGEHGLWDAHGKVQNLAQAVREVAEHTGNVWTPVIALRREDAERLGYDSAESWQALVNASVCDIAAAYKIQPDNLRWYAAFHRKPNQVHIHMILFSADSKEGYLTKEGIRQVKSAFARRIYHADRMHIYQQKDIARQELQTRTRKAMVECIAQLKHGAVDNPRLEQLTEELAERLLAVKGRKVYGYLPPRVKAIVDAIVEELAKDERVSVAYETWQTLYEQVCLITISGRQSACRSRGKRSSGVSATWSFRKRCNGRLSGSGTPMCGESFHAGIDYRLKKDAAMKPRQRTLRSRHLPSAQPKSDRSTSAAPEDSASSDATASEGTTPPAAEDAPAFLSSHHPNQQKGERTGRIRLSCPHGG